MWSVGYGTERLIARTAIQKTYIYTTLQYIIEGTMVPICWMAKLQTRSNGLSTHRSPQSSGFQPWKKKKKRRPWDVWLSKEFSPVIASINGANVFCFLSSLHLFTQPPRQCLPPTHKVQITKVQSTIVYVPSSELGLSHPLSRQRVFPSPGTKGGGGHSPAGEGLGESQFRKSLSLCLLCAPICHVPTLN